MFMMSRKKAGITVGVVIGLAWSIVGTLLAFQFEDRLAVLNYKLYDLKMQLTSRPGATDTIVHLDVDDRAIRRYGQWPWDRKMSARIVRKLYELDARVVVFDVLYTVKGRTAQGDTSFFEAIRESGNVVSALSMQAGPGSDSNTYVFDDEAKARALYERLWSINVPADFHLYRTSRLKGSLLPLIPIIKNSRALGHIKSTPEDDAVHRRVPLFIKLKDRLVPHLSVAALCAYWNIGPESISFDPAGIIDVNNRSKVHSIPVDREGRMLVNWTAPWTFPSYSVVDLLEEPLNAEKRSRYKDKIVIVGVLWSGSTDVGSTPLRVEYPMNRIHSSAIATMLGEEFLTRIPAFPYLAAVGMVLAVAFPFISIGLRLRRGILVTALLVVSCFSISYGAFALWSCELPIAEILFIFFPSAVASLIVRIIAMELTASRVSKAMARYISPELLDQVADGTHEMDLSTRRKDLTVLFVDIVGFSSKSESADVEEINTFLNEFFDAMTDAVFTVGGTVDKFLGDGLLAFFGDPIPLENHALAAVTAAKHMQKAMEPLNHRWARSGVEALEKGVQIRIGIHTGPVVVGNIGSSRRMEYTVLGTAVNLSSRLQGLANPGGIVITAHTRSMLPPDVSAECEGPEFVRAKGFARDVEIYRIDNPSEVLSH